jgi:hypothetical protein
LYLADLPDGVYALVSSANVDGRLLDSDPWNNSAVVYVALVGRSVTIVPQREITREACLTHGFC